MWRAPRLRATSSAILNSLFFEAPRVKQTGDPAVAARTSLESMTPLRNNPALDLPSLVFRRSKWRIDSASSAALSRMELVVFSKDGVQYSSSENSRPSYVALVAGGRKRDAESYVFVPSRRWSHRNSKKAVSLRWTPGQSRRCSHRSL